jgi:hypothetical protein
MIIREQQQPSRLFVKPSNRRYPFPFFPEEIEHCLLTAFIGPGRDKSRRFVEKKIAKRPALENLILQFDAVPIQIDPAMWVRFHLSVDGNGTTLYEADRLRPGCDTEL